MSEYALKISCGDAIQVLKGKWSTVKWPERMRASPMKRDKTKWCKFYRDYRYITENCSALKNEVISLLKRGYLLGNLSDKGKQLYSTKRFM